MAGPSTRPSTKGYSAVPTEERIDDGVEEPQRDDEGEDDELYRPSAPLLSARTRGNEPALPDRTCWYHRVAAWRPFRRQQYSAWDAPSKPRSWRRILLLAYLVFMTVAAIALGISTGVITSEYQHYRSSRGSCRSYSYDRHTRVPMNDAWRSSNNRLDFVSLYPRLEPSPSSACQSAWSTLRYVPCHEKIWNRSWDNGKHSSLFDPDPAVYAQAICSTSCTNAINRAFQLISSMCTEEDKFDKKNYQGSFSVDPGLEDGPLGVITTISKRLTHTCRKEPTTTTYYGAAYCAASMWEDWFVVDGMNAGNLNGLDSFKFKTREYSEERWTRHYRSVVDQCDDVSYYTNGHYGYRRWGPTVNSTTCDWCTMNWFERKLLAWNKDEVRNPETGEFVELPSYLKQIKSAGQRCEKDSWDRVWGRALRKYKDRGDLPKSWDGSDESAFGTEKQEASENPKAPFPVVEAVPIPSEVPDLIIN